MIDGQQPPLLIIEDDAGIQNQLKWCFDGIPTVHATDRKSAISLAREHKPSVVTLDLGLPPDPGGVSEGFALLEELLALVPDTKIIIISGHDNRKNAVRAIGMGAYDFYEKPIEPELLGWMVIRARRVWELERENARFVVGTGAGALDGVVAASTEMLQVCRSIEKIAPTNASVLLLGESGTGKELLVKALHYLSPRAKGPLIAINCAAIPDTLLESELFGFEKGAFTGAVKQTIGQIEMANGGTLFLDEIGDLPLPLQAKLLRFLQERAINRVGGRQAIPVDVRVVCATHRDLPTLINSDEFRQDLYYRIAEIEVEIPPLRERSGDSVLLARVFLERFSKEHAKSIRGYMPDALKAIDAYSWPGNVREVENRVKRAVIMCDGNLVSANDLQLDVHGEAEEDIQDIDLRTVRDAAEKKAISRALSLAEDNVSRTAQLLGVTRPTLYTLMRKHEIKT